MYVCFYCNYLEFNYLASEFISTAVYHRLNDSMLRTYVYKYMKVCRLACLQSKNFINLEFYFVSKHRLRKYLKEYTIQIIYVCTPCV